MVPGRHWHPEAVPPFNETRRDQLADAAMHVLARDGARGLTHRAVDAQAGEPPGTTSRYFRTREALLRGVLEWARQGHFADLERAPAVAGGRGVRDAFVGIVHSALTTNRTRHLAMLELFLESNRRPELRQPLAQTRDTQRRLIRDLHRRGGVAITDRQAAMLVNALTGAVFIALTGAPDPDRTAAALELTRAAIGDLHRA